MKVRITPFSASGEITAPPSKSFAHRYLIAAFLSGKKCTVKGVGNSDDVLATIGALKSLGGKIELRDEDAIVSGRKSVENVKVDCAESGSTLRFLMPVAAALGVSATFTGSERLMERPIEDLARAVKGRGAEISGHKVSGQLQCGRYYLDASLSSQYVSGMLFALSALNGESEIIISGDKVSKGYIDVTLSVLKEFGVKAVETPAGYRISGGYNPPDSATVEGDWSGAAFPLAIGALTGSVTVNNLKYPTLQADGAIVNVLERFGAKVFAGENSVRVERGELRGVEIIDCENFPDIAQVICSVAAFSKGKTRLTGVNRLKIKESDRIAAIINTLKRCGISAEYDGKTLSVFGGRPKGNAFHGGGDHRTVMSAAVIAAAADGVSEITDAERCAKSYPDFFSDLKSLGGKVDVNF